MKVVLLKDVPRVGRKYDVKDVADGYALNFLIPRKLAQSATSAALGAAHAYRLEHEKERTKSQGELRQALAAVRGATITISAKANEKGHLFKGIHAQDISRAIEEQLHITLGAEHIVLPGPIKTTDDHSVTIRIGDASETCTVSVVSA